MNTESQFLHKEPCPSCGSKDNLARYDDGHGFCFGCEYTESGDAGTSAPVEKKKKIDLASLGNFESLPARKISDLTCAKMKYSIGEYQGKKAHVVNVPDQDGNIVAQKIRMAGKEFRFIGDTKNAGLVFQDIWPKGSSAKIVLCEGEIDALSVSQAQGNKYAVVSVPNGSSGALKACKKAYDYLNSFKEIVIMFDMDAAGREATKDISKLFGSKALIAELPFKDANECLKQSNGKAIIDAIWSAKPYRPDGVVSLSSLRDSILTPVAEGRPWIYDTLTKATYGRRDGELYFIGAGSGIGKTDFFLQQAEADIGNGEGVAMFLLEQPVNETAKRLCGKHAKKRFHIPDVAFEESELMDAFTALEDKPAFLYDHFGSKDWETISDNIRFLSATEHVKHFYVDHLTALVSHEDDERRALDRILAEMSSLAQELNICMYVISHLATPEGKPHEEGGRVMAKHFKGSRSIVYWSHFMFGLERDTQAEDEELRQITTFRVLKDRYTGQATGQTFYLGYETETGILYEKPDNWKPPQKDEGSQFETSRDF